MAIPDHEAKVVDAVGDGIDQILAEEGRRGAVVLDLVKACLKALLVVAVQTGPRGLAPGVSPQVAIQGDHVGDGNPVVAGDAGRRQGTPQHLVQPIRRIRTGGDLRVG
jgi:hypothetical protein